jgi:hypothetical protein
MAFSKIQFIAYCVYIGSDKNQPHAPGAQYPGLSDIPTDIARRCQLMASAASLAQSHPLVSKDKSVLKILVAPEFFFRGPKGAYSMEQYQATLATLQAFASNEKYSDWLFVFGSTIATADPDVRLPANAAEWKTSEVYNIVIAQKGGVGEAGCRIIMKEIVSSLDFMQTRPGEEMIPRELMVYPEAAKPSGVGRERQKHNYGGEGIFEVDDICYGVEICADHYQQRLRKSAVSRGEARVQVQIIPSAGAYITEKSVVAVVGGLVFNCDGFRSTDSVYAPGGISGHSDMRVVTTAATGKEHAVMETVAPLGFIEMSPQSNGVAQGVFFEGAGQLHFYPARDTPTASTRSKAKLWADYKAT